MKITPQSDNLKVDCIVGSKSSIIFGMNRRIIEINSRLKDMVDIRTISHDPTNDPISFIFTNYFKYPNLIRSQYRENSIKHITDQSVAYVLNFMSLDNVLVTCHDIYSWYNKDEPFIYKIVNKYSINGIKKAKKIIAVSEFTKKELIKYLGIQEDRITVIHNGIDHDRYRPNRFRIRHPLFSEDYKNILYVGSEAPRKNIEGLIKALYLLKKKIPNIRLIKVGEHQLRRTRQKLQELINVLGLQKNIFFIGYVAEDIMPNIYNSADLFVFPSFYEGFGIPPIEAMACGTPVVSSNTTSLPEVVGEGAVFINPHDIKSLSEKMYELLTNKDLRDEQIRRGFLQAKNFSWEKATMETFKVYEEMES